MLDWRHGSSALSNKAMKIRDLPKNSSPVMKTDPENAIFKQFEIIAVGCSILMENTSGSLSPNSIEVEDQLPE